MKRLSVGKGCPRCRNNTMVRIERKSWMRWLPCTRHYWCDRCRARIITFMDWAAVRTK